MYKFLANNREELIARCKEKVARRPKRGATQEQLTNGIPLFLKQLQRTLQAEQEGRDGESLKISGPSGGDALSLSEMGVSAAAHGKELLELGFSVDQVVHDYGDLCQAITDLAVERDAPFAIDEFRTLNRCLDNAIADAVTEFSFQRDITNARHQSAAENERIGFLAHELRNSLFTARLAVSALETGNLPISGATGSVLKRSLAGLATQINRTLADVRVPTGPQAQRPPFSLASFIAAAKDGAELQACAKGCTFTVAAVNPQLAIAGDRDRLAAALENLLQNAFKFTCPHTEVSLRAYDFGDRILIEVRDQCGGLAPGNHEHMFTPFTQRNEDRTGLGLGLSIARQSVVADAGVLSVQNLPGEGCIFTISLPRHTLQQP